MPEVSYLFERFPSFGQTFCYREVAELDRHGLKLRIFSIRRPTDEPAQDWDQRLIDRVEYLPDEATLVNEVDRLLRRNQSAAEARAAIAHWGRQSDFLRLYQAASIGLRLREGGVRRVHAHFAGMATRTAYWIQKFFGIPFSFTAHANDIFAPRVFAIGLEKLMSEASAIVAVSDYGAEFLRSKFPTAAAKVHRIYNGIDLSAFPAANFDRPVPSIISVGRLIEKKGFADLIAACASLANNGREFTCDIVGEGPLEGTLRAQIHELGVEARVQLVGPETQTQIAARLAAATVFALPCTTEKDGGMDNLPTVIMEAMAAGLPVVSTPLAGIPEMVIDGATGKLVAPGDVGALASALTHFLRDPEQARHAGERGREHARERFSIEGSARSLIELFGGAA